MTRKFIIIKVMIRFLLNNYLDDDLKLYLWNIYLTIFNVLNDLIKWLIQIRQFEVY